MSRTIAALTLMLGLVALSAATYSTATPVRFIPVTESCPNSCICVNPNNEEGTMEVVCPTEETANIIEGGSPPMDVYPNDVMDVEAFIASDKEEKSEENFSLKEDAPEASTTPATKLEASAAPSGSPSPMSPTEAPLVFPIEQTESHEEVAPRKLEIIDEENFTLQPDEEMLGDQPSNDDYDDESTALPTQMIDTDIKPSATEQAKEEAKPSPSATPVGEEEEKLITSVEDESIEEAIVPSAAAEVTATLKPLSSALASTPAPDKFSLAPDNETESKESEEEDHESEGKQVAPTDAPTEPPLVFNDPIPEVSSAIPELEGKTIVEVVESIEDVLKPDDPIETSSTPMPVLAPKVLVDVDTNQLDEVLTSEDLVLASDPEMSGKIQNEDAPGVTQAPEQSTASWVILGLILAMFVGVLLYAAIKGRLDSDGHDMPKMSSISSVVATNGEYTKNRRPSNEGTEMKEMTKSLLGSPLEDRVSRFIDEEDEEQIKRLLQQEADEILEQVIVEQQNTRPVNNALEKPPRKFINVPSPIVPHRDISIPNTPTLVRAKVVDMSPEVHHVGNGSATTTSLQ